jgi:hypothetical protein
VRIDLPTCEAVPRIISARFFSGVFISSHRRKSSNGGHSRRY